MLMVLRQPCHINTVLSDPLPGHADISIFPTVRLCRRKLFEKEGGEEVCEEDGGMKEGDERQPGNAKVMEDKSRGGAGGGGGEGGGGGGKGGGGGGGGGGGAKESGDESV